jgi:hypothetical protein
VSVNQITAARSGDFDRRTGDFDRRTGDFDRRSGGLDRRTGGLDRRTGGLDRRTGDFDRRTGDFDRRSPRRHKRRISQMLQSAVKDNPAPTSNCHIIDIIETAYNATLATKVKIAKAAKTHIPGAKRYWTPPSVAFR